MTALDDYQRLEATGLWRASPDAQRRDVIVSIGKSSLTIWDGAGRAQAHWSLATVRRLNRDGGAALYGPGADAEDTLEIADPTMIRAIETVRSAVAGRHPRPGRLRMVLLLCALAAVLALTVFWLPEAMVRNAVAAVPEAKRAEIGARLLSRIQRVAGTPCETPAGNRALTQMQVRLRGGTTGRIVVLRDGIRETALLPGDILLVNRALVEDFEDPAVLAGYVLAEDVRGRMDDPLARLLRERGPLTAFSLLATGDIAAQVLDAHAEALVAMSSEPVPDETLLAAFRAAGVPSAPYAFARDISGETVLGLIEADPGTAPDRGPVLTDSDWLSVQAICDE